MYARGAKLLGAALQLRRKVARAAAGSGGERPIPDKHDDGVCQVECLGESGTGLAESSGGLRVPIGLIRIELQEIICVLAKDVA